VSENVIVIAPTWRYRDAAKRAHKQGKKLESELVRGSHPTKGVCIPLVHLLRWLMESEDGQG
jgi:hypothetical protein